MKTISEDEKNDLMLALALAFDRKNGLEAEVEKFAEMTSLVKKTFSASSAEDFENLKKRAEFFDSLPEKNRRFRHEFLLDKIRRRGIAARLDENINATHLAENLRQEPKAVQNLILKNLPSALSRRLAKNLEIEYDADDFLHNTNASEKKVRSEITSLVKRKFLANFAAFENIYEPDIIDRFTGAQIDSFIRHLGLREIALVCRGIESKETLAAFLNRFSEADAREIALYITELERIKPFWVSQANELIRQIWIEDVPPDKVLRRTGLYILAETFALRDETSKNYAAQKMSVREAKNWLILSEKINKNLSAADEKERLRIEKRRKSVINSATKFVQTERL